MENETQPASAAVESNDLQTQILWLRKQVFTMLVLTIVVSGTLNVYLWRLGKQRNAEVKAVRPQVAPLIAQYQLMVPRLQEFERRITEYGRTHPDFAPIMQKYQLGGAPGSAPPPPPPSAAAPSLPTGAPPAK